MSGGKPVGPLFTVVTRRRSYLLQQDGETLAELSLDDTQVGGEASGSRRLSRVEVEQRRNGGLEAARTLIEAMVRACQLTPAESSKFEAGLMAANLAPEAAFDFGYAELTEDATAGEFAYALLRRYAHDFLWHEPGTRLGEDPEELHDMRVAARRLRAAMGTFQTVLPLRFEGVRAELQWIGACLGEVRDLDVQLDWLEEVRRGSDWEDNIAVGPLIEELTVRREAARGRLLEALASERYLALVANLGGALREGDTGQGEAALPIRTFGAQVLKRRYRQFRRQAAGLTPESEAAAYHGGRIHAKRMRYSLEALQGVFGARALRLAGAMRAVQDRLGEYQDSNLTVAWLKQVASERGAGWPPTTLLRMGELREQRRARMAVLREEWPRAFAAVEKRWPALQKVMKATSKQDEPEDDEAQPPEPQPVQRSFWLLQRFFGRGGGEIDASS